MYVGTTAALSSGIFRLRIGIRGQIHKFELLDDLRTFLKSVENSNTYMITI